MSAGSAASGSAFVGARKDASIADALRPLAGGPGLPEGAMGAVPPVVFVHGFAQRPTSFVGVGAALEGDGAGQSDALRGTPWKAVDLYGQEPTSFEQAAQLVAAAVADLRAQTGCTPMVAGYSMGGRIVLEAVVRGVLGKGAVSGVLVESAGLGPADEQERRALAERNAAWCARLRRDGVAAFMDWWEELPLFASQKTLAEEVRAAIRAERLAHSAEALARSLEAWGQQNQACKDDTLAAMEELASAGVPVGYAVGALDGKYCALASQVARQAPSVKVAVVPDAGHNVHRENPAAFRGVLAALAAR